MKILISPDTQFIADREECKSLWNVDQIMVWHSDLQEDLDTLPLLGDNPMFFVPTVLDTANALAYDGANLALRIFFRYLNKYKRGVDIVLMGSESCETFLKHYSYPNVLKIPGVDYCFFNQKIVSEYCNGHQKEIQGEHFLPYMDRLGISLPPSFKSSHSMTNEWCLYKWSDFMNFEYKSEGIDDILFFDYLKAKHKICVYKDKQVTEEMVATIKKLPKTRILLVDDNEKWHTFFNRLFATSNVTFKAIGTEFKALTIDAIKARVREPVEEFDPQIVLLDYRLNEDRDANVKSIKQISGSLVLEDLKGTPSKPHSSFGRQVLIFSATSRIEIIMTLRRLYADNFIFKEKPENYLGKDSSKESIRNMINALSKAAERAEFLISLIERINTIARIIESKPESFEGEDGLPHSAVFGSIYHITQTNDLDETVLRLVYINFFTLLENLKKVHSHNDKQTVNYEIKEIAQESNLDQKSFRLWDDICGLRNAVAHGNLIIHKGYILNNKKVSKELLLKWTLHLSLFIENLFKAYVSKR